MTKNRFKTLDLEDVGIEIKNLINDLNTRWDAKWESKDWRIMTQNAASRDQNKRESKNMKEKLQCMVGKSQYIIDLITKTFPALKKDVCRQIESN